MNISHYFDPITIDMQRLITEDGASTIGDNIHSYVDANEFPEPEDGSIVIFGVGDDRGAVGNKGCANAANQIRKYLYALTTPDENMKLYDLGNLNTGKELDDTHYAVIDVMHQLIEHNITTILIGGGQDITYAMYKAYELVERIINICAIDPRFDISSDNAITSRSYLNHIVMQQPNYLFNFTTLGYQTYLVGNDHIRLMDELNFNTYRLGYIQENINRAEPMLRNADLVTIDISAIRQSDAPANAHPSPHGFYGEQLCQLARFAGMSDKVSSLGLFEMNPLYDNQEQTAQMNAHMLWYFIEGYYNRCNDLPYLDRENYKQYLVQLMKPDLQITFYKSMKSDRWWVEVPCNDEEKRQRYQRHLLIPCTYEDYQQAMTNEPPDLWLNYINRLQW